MTPDVWVLLAFAFIAVLALSGLMALVAYAEAPIPAPETPDTSRGTQPADWRP